jgi:hypothetical protein
MPFLYFSISFCLIPFLCGLAWFFLSEKRWFAMYFLFGTIGLLIGAVLEALLFTRLSMTVAMVVASWTMLSLVAGCAGLLIACRVNRILGFRR